MSNCQNKEVDKVTAGFCIYNEKDMKSMPPVLDKLYSQQQIKIEVSVSMEQISIFPIEHEPNLHP